MEKRKTIRHKVETSVVCSYLTSRPSAEAIEGIVKNCCRNGLYAELKAHFHAGTIVIVRALGSSCEYSREEGFRSLTLAEVKWSERKSVKGQVCYATGLKYVMT